MVMLIKLTKVKAIRNIYLQSMMNIHKVELKLNNFLKICTTI